MNSLKGLAWDDQPEKYMLKLKDKLSRFGMDLEICDERDDFHDRFLSRRWDFVILDLVEEASGELAGISLAHFVANQQRPEPGFPIFILTDYLQTLVDKSIQLPLNASIRYKAEPVSVAQYIKEDLVQKGIFVNRKKVFQINCSKKEIYKNYGEKVKRWLENKNIATEAINGDLMNEIIKGLLSKMNECAAIVAVCTPDDQQADNTYYPRLNVLLEIGIALGLSRGMSRLVILQKYGKNLEDQAQLPSDLGGFIPIRFESDISEAFPQMQNKLQEIGVMFD